MGESVTKKKKKGEREIDLIRRREREQCWNCCISSCTVDTRFEGSRTRA